MTYDEEVQSKLEERALAAKTHVFCPLCCIFGNG